MTMLTHTTGSYPATLQGEITINTAPATNFSVGDWVYVGTWATATFKAKVVKFAAGGTVIRVKKISGVLASADALKGRTADGTADVSGATGTVATITATTVSGIGVNYGGWNLRETDSGIVRSKRIGTRTIFEVMIAQRQLYSVRTDFATVATFTLTGGAWGGDTVNVYDVSNGDYITLAIKSSEPVRMTGAVTYAFSITGIGGKTATYYGSSSDGLTHTFRYPIVIGDTGGTALTVSAGNFTIPAGGSILEVADDGTVKALSGTVAVAGTLASKTGITIQA